MAKNGLTYSLLILVIIFLAASTGLFFYNYQQNSQAKISISTIVDYYGYNLEYNKEVYSLQGIVDKINYSQDYTSCMNWVSKNKELHTRFKEGEKKSLEYFQSLSVNKECSDAIAKYSSLANSTQDVRARWEEKEERWCYGWHKMGWTSTWTEEYWTPLNLVIDELNAKEDALNNAFLETEITCLKQLVK